MSVCVGVCVCAAPAVAATDGCVCVCAAPAVTATDGFSPRG